MGHLNSKVLKQKLDQAKELIEIGSLYFHYKNPDQYYSIESLCIIEDTEEVGVLYKPLYGDFGDIIWLRPISIFLETIQVDSKKIQRFQKK